MCARGKKREGRAREKITEKYRENKKKERGRRLQDGYGGRGRMLGRVK